MNPDEVAYLAHFGVKGMKWGVHKKIDSINASDRTIKSGTTIQNISKSEYKSGGKRIYASYTDYDKALYRDMMGNFEYNGKGYINTMHVKKDIKIPSDRKLVDEFVKMAKQDPASVAKDLASADKVNRFFARSEKHYSRKISSISSTDTRSAEKLTKRYIQNTSGRSSMSLSAGKFYRELSKQGYGAISDVNDRDGSSQDPLIIFDVSNSLGKVKSTKMTPEALDAYSDYALSKEHKKTKTLDRIQR